jgi:GT2 family glycosyltransferase
MPESTSPELPQPLSVSVIVPVHQDNESFRSCLKSLAQAIPPPDEVLVVADGDANSIRQSAGEYGYRWLQNRLGSGPARSRNLGASHTRGDLLFFIDSDVAVPQDIISRVKRSFSREPQPAAVIGSYDDAPAAGNFLSQYRNLFHHFIHQHSREEASTFWGACGAIRRDVFIKLGGFSERYARPCIEDIELGIRIKKAGYAIRLSKAFQCKHLKRYGLLSLLKSDIFDRALPWTELILRNRAMINDLNLRTSSRLSVIFLFLALGFFGAGFWNPACIGIALLLFAAVIAMNLPVYRFFYTKRGFWFMIRAVFCHCIYYLCCGSAFAVGLARVFNR